MTRQDERYTIYTMVDGKVTDTGICERHPIGKASYITTMEGFDSYVIMVDDVKIIDTDDWVRYNHAKNDLYRAQEA